MPYRKRMLCGFGRRIYGGVRMYGLNGALRTPHPFCLSPVTDKGHKPLQKYKICFIMKKAVWICSRIIRKVFIRRKKPDISAMLFWQLQRRGLPARDGSSRIVRALPCFHRAKRKVSGQTRCPYGPMPPWMPFLLSGIVLQRYLHLPPAPSPEQAACNSLWYPSVRMYGLNEGIGFDRILSALRGENMAGESLSEYVFNFYRFSFCADFR